VEGVGSSMEQPLVSAVIPFYSGANWLKEAVDSVLNQTYKNIEVLIINDGSLENIDDISKEYGPVIKIFNKNNGGPASARNLGIEKASGKYIAFLDSDDLWLPDKLSKQISYMELTNHAWSQHSYEMFWENSDKTKLINTKIYSGNVYRQCFISFKVQTSCVVVLRSMLIEDHIRFPIEKRYGQDGDFYRQIAKSYPLGCIEGVYSRFRIRGSNAGFRAKVQLNSKGLVWSEIKDDNEVLKILPKPIIFAYKTSSVFSNFINYLNCKCVQSKTNIEIISKIMYAFPYIIFKCYSNNQFKR
jgi:glycosyltransferase involved in cell wall biosynthesis